ncbi:MAG: hypothetical protein K2K39_02770 [Clostridia bacterium]|nr:hypothetical protein [Clostridia bacterium]
MKPQNTEDVKVTDENAPVDEAVETKPVELEPVKEVKEVRRTISAEETFTLAKDVFDLRNYIMAMYSNRAQIMRRINIANTVIASIFTLLYVAFVVFSGIKDIVSYTSMIVVYSIIGVNAALTVVLITLSVIWGTSATSKNIKRKNRTLRILRFIVRAASLAMSVTAVILAIRSGTGNTLSVAIDVLVLVVSIIFLLLSLLPIIFNGLGGFIRWLMSPTKVKLKFSFVVLEWYELLNTGNGASKSVQRVAKNYLNDIGRCMDSYLIPTIGKKKVGNVDADRLNTVLERTPQEDRPIVEGVIKNVFDYAMECGYIRTNPCKYMNLAGSIEVEEKKEKKTKKLTLKERIGKKISKGIINSILNNAED